MRGTVSVVYPCPYVDTTVEELSSLNVLEVVNRAKRGDMCCGEGGSE